MSSIRTDEDRLRLATDNVTGFGSNHRKDEIEQEARSVARFYGTDEDNWEEYLPLLIAVEAGRLKAVQLKRETPAYREAFIEFMRNR